MIQKTEELIDNMPNTAETARELSYLWGNAFPQLRTLLPKAGAWTSYSTPGQLAPGQLAPGQLAPGQLAPGQLAPGQLAPGTAWAKN